MPDEEQITEEQRTLVSEQLKIDLVKARYRRILFYGISFLSAIMLFLAAGGVAFTTLCMKPTTQNTVVIGMLFTAPIILILALLRFVYSEDNKKDDLDMPTLTLNIIKEAGNLFKDYLKSKP